MLKISRDRKPVWVPVLPGVRIQFRPHEPADVIIARKAASRVLLEGGDHAPEQAGDAFTIAVARRLAVAWEGELFDDETGEALACTPDHVEALLRQKWRAFEAVDREVVAPILAEDEEKNGSSPSPTGTSAVATSTAAPAVPSAAPSARTSRTSRKPKPASSPGK